MMTDDPIPYGRQLVEGDDLEAVAKVLTSAYLTTGPQIADFEVALQQRTGVRYAAALSSGTGALHALYTAAGIGPGDSIVTSPITFAATANAALYVGARVEFADVEPTTGLIDPASVSAIINPSTRAVVAVDYAGVPADYTLLRQITEARGTSLFADAAHSLGATGQGPRNRGHWRTPPCCHSTL